MGGAAQPRYHSAGIYPQRSGYLLNVILPLDRVRHRLQDRQQRIHHASFRLGVIQIETLDQHLEIKVHHGHRFLDQFNPTLRLLANHVIWILARRKVQDADLGP